MLSKLCSIFLATALLLTALAGCSGGNPPAPPASALPPAISPSAGGESAGVSLSLAEDNGSLSLSSTVPVEELTFTDKELDSSFDPSSAAHITLSDSGSAVSGRGATVSGNTVTISAAGTYILSGSLSAGQVVVNGSNTDKIQLVLQDVNITCPDSAAIYIVQADKVFLTIAEGTENTVSCGEVFSAAAQQAEVTGAIFSKDDLAINGSGTLIVNGSAQHGIVSKDDLSIADASLIVTAASDGIRGRDCVRIASGSFAITSGSDGIQSNNDTDAALGYVYIAGGSYSITAANDGIQAETLLCVEDGSFSIQTGGGSANAPANLDSGWEAFFRGDRHNRKTTETASSDTAAAVDTAASDSFKGLKAGVSLVISGGSFTLDTADDAIHCDGDIAIREGSTITISSGDDGIHAELLLSISGGSMTVSKSYEGLEGTRIQISGGNTSVTSSDDGLNASDGSGGFGGLKGMLGSAEQAENAPVLLISGSQLYVNANGDGLDSNGHLNITGGEIFVDGPTNSGNGAIDCGDGFEAFISGGTLVAAGASGMAESFGSESTQCSMLVNFGTTIAGNTQLNVIDSTGSHILSYTPSKAYQCAVISSPLLKTGETYTITAGTSSVQMEMTSVSVGAQGSFGGMGGNKPGGFGGMDGGRGDRTDRDPSFKDGTIPEMPDFTQQPGNMPQNMPQRPNPGSGGNRPQQPPAAS